jgi:hypothetical protein
MPRTSAKIRKRTTMPKQGKISLDTFSEKPRRGRPVRVQPSWVRGRADNYRWIFDQIWKHIWPRLCKAETHDDVVRAFQGAEVGSYAVEFVISADLILQVVRDPDFPKRKREAQINFLADSIAGHGLVTSRSSRDICEKERARIKRAHHIILYEFWIECSCGYKGRSLNHACPKCEAAISLSLDSPLNTTQPGESPLPDTTLSGVGDALPLLPGPGVRAHGQA